MRLLLINPFYPISETPSPPLGLAYLAAALEKAGVEVKILDYVVYPYAETRLHSALNGFQPHMVGVTSVTMTFDQAMKIVRDVKRIDPDLITVMGGPHVTHCAEQTLRLFPDLDLVVLGEGEQSIVDLAGQWEKDRDWRRVRGIAFRDGDRVCVTPPRKVFFDMDAVPMPARHLVPLGRYRALGMPLTMTTSRGCPFHCIFCVGRKMFGPRVRFRHPDRVLDELEALSRLRFHQINIADDLFTANRRHCLDICEGIVQRNIHLKWACFARVDTVSRGLLQKMREAGCGTISFGVESANKDILKTVKKGITLDQVVEAVNLCVEAGVMPHASFILGLPGETPETLKETTDFGKRLKDMGASYGFHLLAPFPGTRVREEREAFGLKILTDDWSQYHANRAIVETPSVSCHMLDRIAVEWEEKFDAWLGEIKQAMLRGEAAADDAWQVIRLEHTVLLYDLMMDRVLEEHGTWRLDGTPGAQDGILSLAARIARKTTCKKDQLMKTLRFAVDQDYLRCTGQDGLVRWEWVENF